MATYPTPDYSRNMTMPGWLQRDWCSSFVLALGHFLWQGALIALVLAVAQRATKAVAARYWLSLAALLLMAVSPRSMISATALSAARAA